MRRHQLEHAIRTVCQIIQHSEVIVVGWQAILGTYDESQLLAPATMSIEVGILPIAGIRDQSTHGSARLSVRPGNSRASAACVMRQDFREKNSSGQGAEDDGTAFSFRRTSRHA